jgi:hypothetical protein
MRLPKRTEPFPFSEPNAAFWRWALIVSQVIIVGYTIVVSSRRVDLPFLETALLVVPSWLFLFFGSPFLVRSQGKVAIIGWCIAAGLLLLMIVGTSLWHQPT